MSATPPDETDDPEPDDGDSPEQPQDGDETQDQDHSSTGTVGTTNQYAVEDYVRTTAEGDAPDTTLTIGGVTVAGVFDVTQSGAGRKSQYLVETQVDGGGEQSAAEQYQFDADQQSGGDGGDGSGSNTDQPPPLTVEASAYVGAVTYAELDAMRSVPATEETFAVELGDISLADCELVELSRELVGEQREVYECTIRIREFREYEVLDNSQPLQLGPGGGSGDGGPGSGPSWDGGRSLPTPGESGVSDTVRGWVDSNNDNVADVTQLPINESGPSTLTVGGGETAELQLGDGDALANTLIDVTASGARCHIRADGGSWAIFNVGVRGAQPTGDDFLMHVVGGGDCVIEHCYFGDGGEGGTGNYTGIFVNARHSGDLLIRNCNFSNWPDNAIYGSPPGNVNKGKYAEAGAEGHGGTVRVVGSYFDNNHVAAVRLAGPESSAVNCVATNNVHRGFWAFWQTVVFQNCHSSGGSATFDAGEPAVWDLYNEIPVADCRECHHDGPTRARRDARIEGDLGTSPRTDPPQGVPMSADAAASGPS